MAELNVNVFLQDAILEGLYSRDGIFNLLPDYSYKIKDRWADSVDFPRNPQLVARRGPVTKASGNRQKIKEEGIKSHNVPFGKPYTIAISEEAEANFMSNGQMAESVIRDGVDALGDTLDVDVCEKFATDIPAGQIIPFASDTVIWKDLVQGAAKARGLKIGAKGLLYLIPPSLEPDVKDIDVIKLAMSNNSNFLEGGVTKVDGNFYAYTAAVPQVNDKDAILIVNLRLTGKAVKKWMERKDAYDRDDQSTDIDYLTYVAFDKLRPEAVIALSK